MCPPAHDYVQQHVDAIRAGGRRTSSCATYNRLEVGVVWDQSLNSAVGSLEGSDEATSRSSSSRDILVNSGEKYVVSVALFTVILNGDLIFFTARSVQFIDLSHGWHFTSLAPVSPHPSRAAGSLDNNCWCMHANCTCLAHICYIEYRFD